MAGRGMTTAALSAVVGEQVNRTVAIKLDFDSAPVLLAGTPHSIWIPNSAGTPEEYLGIGAIGEISVAEESTDLASNSLTVSVKGIETSEISLALTEPYQNRPATLYEVLYDNATGQVIDTPVVIYRGRMNQMVIKAAQGQITLTVKNRLSRWERASDRRYTNADQKRDYPADDFFDQVSATAEKEIIWPGKNYFK